MTLWRGARGLGLGIAGGADDAAGGGGVFVSHIAPGGAAHHDGRLRIGDKILAVRDEDVSLKIRKKYIYWKKYFMKTWEI